MNQRLYGSLNAVLLTTVLGTTASCHAEPTKTVRRKAEANNSALLNRDSSSLRKTDALKVGEYQSQSVDRTKREIIARVYPHESAGRQAATLYVRDVPILTFVGSTPITASDTKVGEQLQISNLRLLLETEKVQSEISNLKSEYPSPLTHLGGQNLSDPVWRATIVAAKLNQLHQNNLDALTIAVSFSPENPTTYSNLPFIPVSALGDRLETTETSGGYKLEPLNDISQLRISSSQLSRGDRYIIKADGQQIVEIDDNTRLPDTTYDIAEDALRVTNQLRQLMGNVPPLTQIERRLLPVPQTAAVRIRSSLKGVASWYGPGFHGRRSASGEIYNQNALTAAHRTLAFGTQVRVTNMNNGLSVVVRINDRGPYIGGRVIDLSAAAAQILGIVQTGVAPVTLDVLGR